MKHSGQLDWDSLQGNDCVFVGTKEEHHAFTAKVDMRVPFYQTNTYRELAEVIKGSDLFVGNQSFPYALAEAMKVHRVLEVGLAPNCMPQGERGRTFVSRQIVLWQLETGKAWARGGRYV
jgi:hypothetical protein